MAAATMGIVFAGEGFCSQKAKIGLFWGSAPQSSRAHMGITFAGEGACGP
jgi:hypothetical protein